MADHQHDGFGDSGDEVTAEDLLDLLQSNTLAMFLATIHFLDTRQIPVGEWVDALGGAERDHVSSLESGGPAEVRGHAHVV